MLRTRVIRDILRAIIYLRVSTGRQAGMNSESLPTQERQCRAYAARMGYDVVEVIVDPGKSGKDIARPEYRRLLAKARAGEMEVVITWAIDRFGRKPAESFRARDVFSYWGVALESATESNDPVAQDYAMVGASHEVARTKKRVSEMQMSWLERNRWIGRAPRGYVVDKHRNEAGVPDGGKQLYRDIRGGIDLKVAELITLYSTGTYGLARLANEAELRWGLKFTKSNLGRLISNPAYTGRVVWGRKVNQEDEEGFTHSHRTAPDDWYVGEPGAHEALVTQEVWDKAQAVLERNRTKGAPTPRDRKLLVGMIWCGCGSRMQGGYTRRYHYYGCYRRRNGQGCTEGLASVNKIDPIVKGRVEMALRPYADPAFCKVAKVALARMAEADVDEGEQRRQQFERKYRELKVEIVDAARKNAQGVLDDEIFAELQRVYKTQTRMYETALADVPAPAPAPDYSAEIDLVAAIEDWSDLSPELWADLVAIAVERVTVTAGVVEVTLRSTVARMAEAGAAGVREGVLV